MARAPKTEERSEVSEERSAAAAASHGSAEKEIQTIDQVAKGDESGSLDRADGRRVGGQKPK